MLSVGLVYRGREHDNLNEMDLKPKKIMHDQIEQVFGLIDREIWIVTAAAGGKRGGLVATWVSQASIDKHTPTVVVGIAANHYT